MCFSYVLPSAAGHVYRPSSEQYIPMMATHKKEELYEPFRST